MAGGSAENTAKPSESPVGLLRGLGESVATLELAWPMTTPINSATATAAWAGVQRNQPVSREANRSAVLVGWERRERISRQTRLSRLPGGGGTASLA